METTGLDRVRAREVIAAADGSVKVAIVMARRGVSRAEAERLLAAAQRSPPGHRRRPPAREACVTERPSLGVGLMSGTSLDGMDAALVRFHGPTHADLLAFATRPYSDAERDLIRAALDGGAARDFARLTSAPRGMGLRSGTAGARLGAGARLRSRIHRVSRADHLARAAAGQLAARRGRPAGRAVRRAGGEQFPRARRRGGWSGRATRPRRRCAPVRSP